MTYLHKYADLITNEMYEAMSKDEAPHVREFVAAHTKSQKIICELLNDDYAQVLVAIANNPNTNSECLSILSKNSLPGVMKAVASNPKTPVECLETLSLSTQSGVSGAVALNPSTPDQILLNLSKYYDKNVLRLLAQNPKTPREALLNIIHNLM